MAYPYEQEVKALQQKTAAEWKETEETFALHTFKIAATRVPAYQAFLHENGVNPASIKTILDFKRLPLTSKENYVMRYPFKDRCINGDVTAGDMVSVSSGSTGEPQFWVRDRGINDDVENILELIFRESFQIHKKRTLLIMSFSLGTWVAGTCVLDAGMRIADKGYPFTVVSPGIDRVSILRIVKELSPLYEQTILACYPPFGKDVLDEGTAQGLDWKAYNVKFLWGGEAVTEPWRDFVHKKAGNGNSLLDGVNIYGSAEGTVVGFETPLSIALKRLAATDFLLSRQVFQTERMPAIYQYDPRGKHIESIEGELAMTTGGPMPLIRYNLHDAGGVFAASQLPELLGGSVAKLEDDLRVHQEHAARLSWPIVYLFGRPHNNATLYGVNIYPENIRAVLEDEAVNELVSGKFKMSTELSANMDQFLLLKIELARGVEASEDLEKQILDLTVSKVSLLNSEYHKLQQEIGVRAVPHLQLLPHDDPTFMPGGIKLTTTVKK